MSVFALLLIVKIVVTLLGVALPMLLLRRTAIDGLLGMQNTLALYRLYGVAITALIVAYVTAFVDHLVGGNGLWVLPVAITSNAGAVLVLAFTYSGAFRWPGLLFFGAVALGFIAVWLAPGPLARPLW